METADIDLIELRTGIRLPSFYVELVTKYPAQLTQTDAPDFGLLNDAESVIQENLSVRAQGYFGEPWPEQYFIIGHNGCGDYYVIKHADTVFSVGFADHEIMACNLFAASRAEFIELLITEMGQ